MSESRSPLRVLHLRDTDRVCGPGKTIMETALATDRSRFDQLVGLFLGGPDHANAYFRAATARGVEVVPVRSSGRFDPKVVGRLIKVIRSNRIDLLHSHEYKSDIAGFIASRVCGIPIVSTAHGFIQNSRRARVLVGLGQRLLRHFDRVIAVSDETRERLIAVGVPSQRVNVIHNAIVTKNYNPADFTRGKFRAAYGIDAQAPLIGYVGRLSPEKGQRELLLAGVDIVRARPDARVVLIGDGPDEIRLRELAHELGVERAVTFTGHLHDVREALRDLDVLALTSYTEGFPNVVLEALCMDVPVVASDVGGVREIIEDGRTGLLVPPRAPQAIAAAVVRLVNDAQLSVQLASAGRRAVYERFSFERRVRTEEALYDDVLRKRSARRGESR